MCHCIGMQSTAVLSDVCDVAGGDETGLIYRGKLMTGV